MAFLGAPVYSFMDLECTTFNMITFYSVLQCTDVSIGNALMNFILYYVISKEPDWSISVARECAVCRI